MPSNTKRKQQRRKRAQEKPQQSFRQSPAAILTVRPRSDRARTLALFLRRARRRAWKRFAAVAMIVGVAALLYPRLTVDVLTFGRPDDPMTVQFLVRNTGYSLITDLEPNCVIRTLKVSGGLGGSVISEGGLIVRKESEFVSWLWPDQQTSASCDFIQRPMGTKPGTLEYGDMSIALHFRVFGIPWPSRAFDFRTRPSGDPSIPPIWTPYKK